MSKQAAKPQKVSYTLIERASDVGAPIYALLDELVTAHHKDLTHARIALAWCTSWKKDADGLVTLGKCRKASDLDRELAAWDFIILLSHAFWYDPMVNALQRRALLDHELCHAAVKLDDRGEPVEDERGRVVYRTRKHDLEEFTEIGARYGCWKGDIEAFVVAVARARQQADDRYIGAQSLQELLRDAGLGLPLETVVLWSDDERREATTWALMKHEQFPEMWRSAVPPFVAAAATAVNTEASQIA